MVASVSAFHASPPIKTNEFQLSFSTTFLLRLVRLQVDIIESVFTASGAVFLLSAFKQFVALNALCHTQSHDYEISHNPKSDLQVLILVLVSPPQNLGL